MKLLAAVLAVTVALVPSAAAAQTSPTATAKAAGAVTQSATTIEVNGESYTVRIDKTGFRYAILGRDGSVLAPAHAQSGLRVKAPGAADFADAQSAALVNDPGAATAVVRVTFTDGTQLNVQVHAFGRYVRFSTADLAGPATIDFRTGPVAPAYGLGDYGAHANGQPDQGTPCSGPVEARPTTELTGIVLDNLTNEGSCKRYITNFTVFPKQRLAQVLLFDGQKRVGLTADENRLGVAGTDSVDDLYYFAGADLPQVYADYRTVRVQHGYLDAKPDPRMFGLGWEAYGALGWNTYQSSVEDTVQAFVAHGYPLSWGVVGSGFWPGSRGVSVEGTTNSFGMWDDTYEEGRTDSQPGLPNPRYPDPDHLKQVFADNGIALMLGARNNFKAYPEDGGNYNAKHDGDSMPEAAANGYLLTDPDGTPTVVAKSQFPSGASYVLDAANPQAVAWFVAQSRRWGAQGWKEDTMLYDPDTYKDGNWNPLQLALHDAGDLMMVRNAAYSVPGDVLRINDTIYGTGAVFHENPDRIPVNLLNYAASGAGNVYGDYVGGTPGRGTMTDPSYMSYFLRNAQFNTVSPVLAFGIGPWELGRADYAATIKDLAQWHESLRPYIYDAVLDGYNTGFPYAMTPLPLAYPDDANTYGLVNDSTRQYEWMFGESLLATPVFGSDFAAAQSRDVYLPAGKWIDYATGAVFTGPRTLSGYAIGADRVPAFVGGKGVLVRRTGDTMAAEVYPIATGSSYTWTDGTLTSRITNANTGWDRASLSIMDKNTGEPVAYTVDGKTGAFRFTFTPGHDYTLAGGGHADHPFPVETSAPATPGGVTHTVTGGIATLTWQPVDVARSYTVSVSGVGRCASVAGSTAGATSLVLGPAESAGGTYRVSASNSAGTSAQSDPYVVPDASTGGPVIVTNEGSPDTCDPAQPAYAETGSWSGGSLKGFDGSGARYAGSSTLPTKTATWRAALAPGRYEVAVWYPSNSANTPDATYRVGPVAGEADGVAQVVVDQRQGAGQWRVLGTYEFTASTTLPWVEVSSGTGGGYVRADAVRFTAVS